MKLNIQLFASGTIDGWWEKGSGGSGSCDCQIVWTSTPNNAGNYSTVTADVQVYKSGDSTTTGTFSGVININGVEYSISKKFSPYRWGSWASVGSATATIPHNNDGTKTINISTYFTNTGTSMAGSYHTQYPNDITLDTIPRGSTFNTSSWNRDTQRQMNSTLSFPATQNVSGVYHKLVAKFMNNGTETTICTRTGVSISGGYISFSFSSGELSTIYNLMPNETTHYIRMYLYTYTNSSYTNQLGDVSILWWTGAIPSSVVPSASFTSYVEGGDVPSSWEVWVKGKSKANLTLTGTGIYSSTISAYSISGDGYTYNTSPVLTNYLSQAGNITFTGVVTDSRGRTGTTTTTLSVVDYTNPTISTAQVQRCDADGNIDNNGEYVYISYGASISSCSGENTPNAVYKVGYRIHNTGDYTYIPLTTNANSYSATGMLYTDGIFAADRGSGTKLQLSTSNTYDIQLFVSDYFTNSTSLQTLDTGFDLMNFNASGKSMAIGKVSEATASEEKLEIALDTEIDGDLDISGILKMKGVNVLQKNSGGATFIGSDSHYITFRPNGLYSESGQAYIDTNGELNVSQRYAIGGESLGTIHLATFTINNATPNSWVKITNDASMTLAEGYYLLVYTITLSAQQGISTLNGGIDGTRYGFEFRSTIPTLNGLGSTGQIVVPVYLSGGSHTFQVWDYCTAQNTIASGEIRVVRIG